MLSKQFAFRCSFSLGRGQGGEKKEKKRKHSEFSYNSLTDVHGALGRVPSGHWLGVSLPALDYFLILSYSLSGPWFLWDGNDAIWEVLPSNQWILKLLLPYIWLIARYCQLDASLSPLHLHQLHTMADLRHLRFNCCNLHKCSLSLLYSLHNKWSL